MVTSRDPDPTVLASHGIRLPDFARSRGIDLDACLAALGLAASSFEDFSKRMPLETFSRLLGLIADAVRDDCIGLSYADSFDLGDIGSFGFAMLNAPTVRAALDVYGRFQSLIAGTAYFSLDVGQPYCAVEWRYASLMANTAHYVDFRAGMMCKMMERLTSGRWSIHSLSLVRPPPASTAQHRALFKNIRFGSPFNRLTFAPGDLDAPVAGADPRLFRLMVQNCEDSLAALAHKKAFGEEVREKILTLLPKRQATLSDIARELGLSERALQRRLGEENRTFEQVLEATRRELAEHLLTQSETSIAEISYLCGYAAASAFTRAARNWFDMPPLAFRRRNLQPAVGLSW